MATAAALLLRALAVALFPAIGGDPPAPARARWRGPCGSASPRNRGLHRKEARWCIVRITLYGSSTRGTSCQSMASALVKGRPVLEPIARVRSITVGPVVDYPTPGRSLPGRTAPRAPTAPGTSQASERAAAPLPPPAWPAAPPLAGKTRHRFSPGASWRRRSRRRQSLAVPAAETRIKQQKGAAKRPSSSTPSDMLATGPQSVAAVGAEARSSGAWPSSHPPRTLVLPVSARWCGSRVSSAYSNTHGGGDNSRAARRAPSRLAGAAGSSSSAAEARAGSTARREGLEGSPLRRHPGVNSASRA
jgi:hypothetical protein